MNDTLKIETFPGFSDYLLRELDNNEKSYIIETLYPTLEEVIRVWIADAQIHGALERRGDSNNNGE